MFCITFICSRYDESELPSTADGVKSWLNDVWRQKEKSLSNFTITSSFIPDTQVAINVSQHIDNTLYLALMFWTLVQVFYIELMFL